jgi:hypothetical protein
MTRTFSHVGDDEDALFESLQELGYVEGQNIIIREDRRGAREAA